MFVKTEVILNANVATFWYKLILKVIHTCFARGFDIKKFIKVFYEIHASLVLSLLENRITVLAYVCVIEYLGEQVRNYINLNFH